MQLIKNSNWLTAIAGGLEVCPDGSIIGGGGDGYCGAAASTNGGTLTGLGGAGNAICYTSTDASCPVTTVANASDCKTDAAQGTALGAIAGAAVSKGNAVAAAAGAGIGLYVATTLSSGCQPVTRPGVGPH